MRGDENECCSEEIRLFRFCVWYYDKLNGKIYAEKLGVIYQDKISFKGEWRNVESA